MSSSPATRNTNEKIPAHNVFIFDQVIFSSNFDNGNLAKVEKVPNRSFEFKIWTAPDNMGSEHQSKHCSWFHFVVSGLPVGCVLRLQLTYASSASGLYKHDMRPVYRSNSTGNKWTRLKGSMRFLKEKETSDVAQIFFEHGVEANEDKIYFAFTYPYSYTTLQNELTELDSQFSSTTAIPVSPDDIYYKRELLTESCDGRRIDLITITSHEGASNELEPLLSGLFPDSQANTRPNVFPKKEIVFISSRVHSGEVPAQHAFKGILNILTDKEDVRAKELRARYVFKLIPMLNPDGVYRGHFRMDQHGQNLNRYYTNPECTLQPSIYGAKSLIDYYATNGKLVVYLDFHAHASKRGCFIYGNVLDSVDDQIQNQLYCKLIALNTPHFDYEGCLFSKEHMYRIDPGDQAKGLTAEGSGRVNTYLSYGLIHSYTIECNYNTSRVANEVPQTDGHPGGNCTLPGTPFSTTPEKYTPAIYAGVGSACVIALLDIRGHNPCSRIPKSKMKTLDRIRGSVMLEVRGRKDYQGKSLIMPTRKALDNKKSTGAGEACVWRRVVDPTAAVSISSNGNGGVSNNALANGGSSHGSNSVNGSNPITNQIQRLKANVSQLQSTEVNVPSEKESVAFSISMKDGHKWERRRRQSITATQAHSDNEEVRLKYSPNKLDGETDQQQTDSDHRSFSSGGRIQESSVDIQQRNRKSSIGRRDTSHSQSLSVQSSASSASFESSLMMISNQTNIVLDRETVGDDRNPNVSVDNRVTSSHNGLTVSIKRRNAASAEKWGRLLDPSLRDRQREGSSSSVSSVDGSHSSKSMIIRTVAPNLSIPQQPLAFMPAPVSARRENNNIRDIPIPPVPKRPTNHVFKDSRRILGKTLHAAGVALIMSSQNPSTESLSSLQNNNSGSECLDTADDVAAVSTPTRSKSKVTSSESNIIKSGSNDAFDNFSRLRIQHHPPHNTHNNEGVRSWSEKVIDRKDHDFVLQDSNLKPPPEESSCGIAYAIPNIHKLAVEVAKDS